MDFVKCDFIGVDKVPIMSGYLVYHTNFACSIYFVEIFVYILIDGWKVVVYNFELEDLQSYFVRKNDVLLYND